ncbi:YggS family pyridoxal phosphate-dependent enzyme [Helicovermis profundi]|uniref:Pyridoxal phosphate homeostasis protein n=1 Tax=Helicovermis profundi TaxID=3065157 RepID=A0AAU9E4G2_9FIRM|nr:YggS family pyridoxal phosphate-dependent enzyme [Clostridia bacterium S502]
MEYLKNNIDNIRENIKKACDSTGREISEITLIAVTKTIDESIVNESLKYDIFDVGENRVQEIQRKYDNIKSGVKWHLIGHLQTNKVKYIIEKVDLIHSVDSIKLAKEIDKRAREIGKVMDILVQINVAKEESKFGINEENIDEIINELSKLNNIKVKGLMNIAPFDENVEKIRNDFKKMKEIFDSLSNKLYNNVEMLYLSMGMTNDYMVAIEEGANMIRVGTGIYGKRDYSK